MRFKVTGICSVEALSALPLEPVRLDLDRAAELLQVSGRRVDNIGVMVTVFLDGREVTVYRNGRITIYPADSKEQAEDIASGIYRIIRTAMEERKA